MANEEDNTVKLSLNNASEEGTFDKAASSVVKESDTSSTVTSETDPVNCAPMFRPKKL
ncbi:hypothetical protein [Candidatus Tisiphia endosymbiont of Beris chalybata]|uniref:hypothetical protein n=1 Tax=Candidatus Tisiphia endosymbiont of Beris chalybata TaxID=3066262 RepID=UPI00312C750B